MLYRKIIREIHPDMNPNIIDASSKINQVLQNKHNESYLKELIKKWKLNIDDEDYSEFYHINFTQSSENKIDIGRALTDGKLIYIILDIVEVVKKGTPKIRIITWNESTNRFHTFLRKDKYDLDGNLYVYGDVNLEEYEDIFRIYNMEKNGEI